MKLSYWELDYVHTRMKSHDIKFQEIYNELFDHIVTAIEAKKESGDTATMEMLYNDVVNTQFGGYNGIEEVAKSHEKGYKAKVNKLIWANYKYYINIWSFLFTSLAIIICSQLPGTKFVKGIMLSLLVLAIVYPLVYVFIKLKGIKPGKGKQSLIYSHILRQAYLPILVLNMVIYLPKIPFIFINDTDFNVLKILNPSMLALVIALMAIYDLSCMRLCRQELKQFVNINPGYNET